MALKAQSCQDYRPEAAQSDKLDCSKYNQDDEKDKENKQDLLDHRLMSTYDSTSIAYHIMFSKKVPSRFVGSLVEALREQDIAVEIDPK